ncbi:hypothetical protein D3C76_1128340 [compost metagenome]
MVVVLVTVHTYLLFLLIFVGILSTLGFGSYRTGCHRTAARAGIPFGCSVRLDILEELLYFVHGTVLHDTHMIIHRDIQTLQNSNNFFTAHV